MAKCLITGGAGFIGSHIVDSFFAQGYEILVVDDLSTGSKDFLPQGVNLQVTDIRSGDTAKLIQKFKPNVIIHAAAQISVTASMSDPQYDNDVNLVGLLNILKATSALKSSPYFVFISTGGALYGEQEVYPAPESHPINPTSFYGLSKFCGEKYLKLWEKTFGLKVGILRLANVYGPRQNPHGEAGVVAIFNQRILEGKELVIYGDGEQTRDFIDVADVVLAVQRIVKDKVSGIFNTGTGVESTVNEICKQICLANETEFNPVYVEPRLGEQRRSCIDPSLFKNELGWEAQNSLADGLKRTAQWFQRHLSSSQV